MDILNSLNPEAVSGFLGHAAGSNMAQNLFILGIVWKMMVTKVSKHFQGMETAVVNVSTELKSFREAVEKQFAATSARLETVEKTMTTALEELTAVKSRLEKVEQKGE